MSDIISESSNKKNKRGHKEASVWDHFIKQSVGSGHYSAKCNYCSETWSRGRPEDLKSHLALFCNVIPQDIKLEYLEILASINSSKKIKKYDSSSDKLVSNYYDPATKIETSKKNRIDQALIGFFICCGIPFAVVGHSYFIDFIQSLCYGYIPPNRTTLSSTILNQEISTVLLKINKELEYENNLILAVDGWCNPSGKSIYAFVIITPSRKQYIHTLVDESSKSHTGSFNASEIERVLVSIGPQKFVAIITDAESAMQLAKQIISTKYSHILSIRCIAHHINLITSNIIKLDFAKAVFKKCQTLISFFKQSYHAGAALQEDIINTFVKGGGLKSSVKTRWSTAWDCCNSIIRLEHSLKNVLENQPEIFQDSVNIKTILHNCQFWQDVEQLETILIPAKRAIDAVETKSSNMALCFLELVKMATAIKNISNIIDSDFKKQCIRIYKKYWKKFDILTYLLVYFLHPKYKGKGFKDKVFCKISLHAMKIWKNFGGKTNSCKILLSQLRKYSENIIPYDIEYVDDHDTPEIWWQTWH